MTSEITSEDSSIDGYVLRLDMDGNFVSVGTVGGTGTDVINGVAVTSSADVYLTGVFHRSGRPRSNIRSLPGNSNRAGCILRAIKQRRIFRMGHRA
ncbi:MAG: hypothetical protein WDO15_23645 [Bacteroidota bacterium]